MDQTFLTELNIVNVRHLHNIKIPLSRTRRKHLILTGKNGSGKTSVLAAMVTFLKYMISDDFQVDDSRARIAELKDRLRSVSGDLREQTLREIKSIEMNARRRWDDGCVATANQHARLQEKYKQGQFILACYRDDRRMDIDPYKDIVKMDLKQVYDIEAHPAKNIGKYLANLKFAQAFAKLEGDSRRDEEIQAWFDTFERRLAKIYRDEALELKFDPRSYQFTINIPGRLPFGLDCMSMGYAAIFDIVGDLMMRMDSQRSYNLEGIVLIDEVETHLHVQLQREVMPMLTELFPNIQFILTSHSPFVLNSTQNAVVFDLESREPAGVDMTMLPYEGIVEGHFETDNMSRILRDKFEDYKAQFTLPPAERDMDRIRSLEDELEQVPTFLALNFKAQFEEFRLNVGR